MADTSRFRVRAFVEELDAPRILLGMRATITADGIPERSFVGTVMGMSARMGPKMLTGDAPDEHYDTKTRQVWISMEEGEPFVVGLRVDVMIDAVKDGGEQLSTVTEPPQRYGPLP